MGLLPLCSVCGEELDWNEDDVCYRLLSSGWEAWHSRHGLSSPVGLCSDGKGGDETPANKPE